MLYSLLNANRDRLTEDDAIGTAFIPLSYISAQGDSGELFLIKKPHVLGVQSRCTHSHIHEFFIGNYTSLSSLSSRNSIYSSVIYFCSRRFRWIKPHVLWLHPASYSLSFSLIFSWEGQGGIPIEMAFKNILWHGDIDLWPTKWPTYPFTWLPHQILSLYIGLFG